MKNFTSEVLGLYYPDLYFRHRLKRDPSFVKRFPFRELRSRGGESADITDAFRTLIEEHIKQTLVSGFQNSLQNTFSSLANLKNKFSKKNFELRITFSSSRFFEKIRIKFDSPKSMNVEVVFRFKQLEYVEKLTRTTKHTINKDGKKLFGKPTESELLDELKDFYFQVIVELAMEIESTVGDIYFLPASRSGLYLGLNSFAPILAELSQSRFFISNKKIELPTLSEPVSDYYIDLSTVNRTFNNEEKFGDAVRFLEQKILRGAIDYDEESKNITYRPKGLGIVLNLSEASSMVAELAPLVIYLRHILDHRFAATVGQNRRLMRRSRFPANKPILFIEEPEAHLHPEVQVDLMSVFSQLVGHTKLFITSHSNYMFHAMNNLILGKRIDGSRIAVYHLVLTKSGTIQADDTKVTPDGVQDSNFQETSERLYEERLELLEVTTNDQSTAPQS